jgi:hypothetical protein
VVSSLRVNANACLNGALTIEANADDATTGNSKIQSASYQLNGSAWYLMSAKDGVFDTATEDVTATTTATLVGMNEVCVKAKDALNNESAATCTQFAVGYAFTGFLPPIDNNDVLNAAKAGQTIPAKWRLTDCAVPPNPIADPTSFAGLYSYPVDCTDLQGNPADAVEEYAPGSSGLVYAGDGYWHFNWQTPKSYANQCRVMYLEFNSTTTSPAAKFKFKK